MKEKKLTEKMFLIVRQKKKKKKFKLIKFVIALLYKTKIKFWQYRQIY